MIIDKRIAEYVQKISQETNPALKRLYKVSMEMLIMLKSSHTSQRPPESEERSR